MKNGGIIMITWYFLPFTFAVNANLNLSISRNGRPKRQAISGNGGPFLEIAGHFWKWQAISGNGRPFLEMAGHFWKWLAISGSHNSQVLTSTLQKLNTLTTQEHYGFIANCFGVHLLIFNFKF